MGESRNLIVNKKKLAPKSVFELNKSHYLPTLKKSIFQK